MTAPAASDTGPRASCGADMPSGQGSKLLGKGVRGDRNAPSGQLRPSTRSGVSLVLTLAAVWALALTLLLALPRSSRPHPPLPAGQDLPPTRRANIRVKLQKKEGEEEEKITAVICVSCFCLCPSWSPLGLLGFPSPPHARRRARTARMDQPTCRDAPPLPSPSPRDNGITWPAWATARLGKAETPVLMGQALPRRPRSARSLHMAIAWQLGCWSHISRHACSAQSCRSLFFFPPRNIQHPGPAGADP